MPQLDAVAGGKRADSTDWGPRCPTETSMDTTTPCVSCVACSGYC